MCTGRGGRKGVGMFAFKRLVRALSATLKSSARFTRAECAEFCDSFYQDSNA